MQTTVPGSAILNKGNPDGFDQMPHWQKMQYKSFRAWLIYNVDGQAISSLTVAVHDGLLLAKLIENLSGQKLKGIEKNPRFRIHYINNVGAVLNFLHAVPITINNISPEDIVDGNVKLTLGFLWILILHYQIKHPLEKPQEAPKKEEKEQEKEKVTEQKEELLQALTPIPAHKGDPKDFLVEKVNTFLELHQLPFEVNNFADDWQDGMRFGALIHAMDSSQPPNWSEWKPENARENLKQCFDIFKTEFGLPEILAVEDLVDHKPDEKSVMTFVAMVFHAYHKKEDKKPKKEDLPPLKTETPPPPAPKVEEPPPPPKVEEPPPPPKVEEPPPPPKVEEPPPKVEEPPPKVEEPPKPKKPKKHKPKKKKPVEVVKPPPEGEHITLRVCAARRLGPVNDDDDDDDNGYPDPYVKLVPKGKKAAEKRKTKPVEKTLHPEWNTEFEFKKEKSELQMEDKLEFLVIDDKSKTTLGVVRLPVKDIAEATESDKHFDEWLPLQDFKTDERVAGDLRIVAVHGDAPLPEPTKYLPIKIRVAAGRDLLGLDSGGAASNPFCKLEVDGLRMKKSRTKTVMETLNPEWDDEFFFDGGIVDAEKDVLKVKVFSEKKKGKDPVPIGIVEFPFKQILETPFLDDWFPVKDPKNPDEEGSGDIRLVVTYGKDLPPVHTEKFLIAVLAARGLEPVNAKSATSNPYVQIWVPGKKSKQLVLKTKDKKKTLEPVWNQLFEFRIQDFDRMKDVIEFHLYSRDLIGDNQPIGIVELAMKDIVNVPYIDSWFAVYNHKNRSKKGRGELHLRIAFGKAEQTKLEDGLDQEEGKKKPSRIQPPATIFRISKAAEEKHKVKVRDMRFHATKGLPITVRIVAAAALKSGHADPYVVVEIPGKKTIQKLKTKVVKNTANPVWNEEFSLAGEPLEKEDRIRFCIHSSDMVGSSLLGLADVPVEDVIDSEDGIYSKALTILNSKGDEDKARGTLHVLLAYGDAKLPEVQFQVSPRARSGTLPLKSNPEIAKNALSSDDIEVGTKKVSKRKGSLKKKSKIALKEDGEEDEDAESNEESSSSSPRKKSSGDVEGNSKHKKKGSVGKDTRHRRAKSLDKSNTSEVSAKKEDASHKRKKSVSIKVDDDISSEEGKSSSRGNSPRGESPRGNAKKVFASSNDVETAGKKKKNK